MAGHQEFPRLVQTPNERLRSLGDQQAHLWWASPDQFTDQDELDRYRALLTDDERQKIAGFRFPADRHRSLISRVLVRTTLSQYANVPVTRWRFRRNDHDRPEIASPASELRFNLSHTRGLVTCLVSRGREVGVDVEALDRKGRWLELADRFFAVREAEALRRIAEPDRLQRFLEYWTLKESTSRHAVSGWPSHSGIFHSTSRQRPRTTSAFTSMGPSTTTPRAGNSASIHWVSATS